MNNKPIYTCDLMGGLGNQMFQISHVLSQSWRYGTECILPPQSNTQNQGNNTSNYINNIFKQLNFSNLINCNDSIFEKSFSFNHINLDGLKSIRFHGYYQSSKNFYGFDNEIKDIFKINNETKEKIVKKYPNIIKDNSVSIHVRRGDYNNFYNVHPVITKEYILNCLSKIYDTSNLYFFSDDKQWVVDNFSDMDFEFVELDYDYEELWSISLCNKNIMSNSSFSWWGAFLNTNKDKQIFCPSSWFGPDGLKDYQDIFEPYFNVVGTKVINSNIYPI